jgi:hypothetical protein
MYGSARRPGTAPRTGPVRAPEHKSGPSRWARVVRRGICTTSGACLEVGATSNCCEVLACRKSVQPDRLGVAADEVKQPSAMRVAHTPPHIRTSIADYERSPDPAPSAHTKSLSLPLPESVSRPGRPAYRAMRGRGKKSQDARRPIKAEPEPGIAAGTETSHRRFRPRRSPRRPLVGSESQLGAEGSRLSLLTWMRKPWRVAFEDLTRHGIAGRSGQGLGRAGQGSGQHHPD